MSGEVDVGANTGFARAVEKLNERCPLQCSRSATDEYYDAGVGYVPRNGYKIIPITGNQYAAALCGHTQHLLIGCGCGQNVA